MWRGRQLYHYTKTCAAPFKYEPALRNSGQHAIVQGIRPKRNCNPGSSTPVDFGSTRLLARSYFHSETNPHCSGSSIGFVTMASTIHSTGAFFRKIWSKSDPHWSFLRALLSKNSSRGVACCYAYLPESFVCPTICAYDPCFIYISIISFNSVSNILLCCDLLVETSRLISIQMTTLSRLRGSYLVEHFNPQLSGHRRR
jgi:hypothetical protein